MYFKVIKTNNKYKPFNLYIPYIQWIGKWCVRIFHTNTAKNTHYLIHIISLFKLQNILYIFYIITYLYII